MKEDRPLLNPPDEHMIARMQERCADEITLIDRSIHHPASRAGVATHAARIQRPSRLRANMAEDFEPVKRSTAEPVRRITQVPPKLLEALFDNFTRWRTIDVEGAPVHERVLRIREFGMAPEMLQSAAAMALKAAGIDERYVTIAKGDALHCESHRGDLVVRIAHEGFNAAKMTNLLRADRQHRAMTNGSAL